MAQQNQTTQFGYQSHSNINNLSLHTTLINEWDFLYHQVSSGKFTSQLNSFWLDEIGIYEEHLSPCIFQQGKAKDDVVCIGVFRRIQQPVLWMGEAIDENDIICIYPNNEVIIKTPEDSLFYALHFPLNLLMELEEQPLNSKMHTLKNKKLNIQLYQKMMEMITVIQRSTQLKLTDLARSYLKSDLIDLAYRYIHAGQKNKQIEPQAKIKANQVVKYLIHYLIEHRDQPISLDKCCELTQMSKRTLQNYFEAVTGQSPSLFLKYWRLNGVRRMLQQAKAQISIGDAAGYWGFWHLSQFATDYKRLFAETPTETLLMR